MLPIMGAPEDIEAVVSYLQTKATGATVSDANATIGAKYVDGRKLSAYEFWGIIVREGDKLKLTELGRRLARATDDKRKDLYVEIIRAVAPYRLAAEWIFHQDFDSITAVDLAAHLHEHIPEALGTATERSIRAQVTTFFSIGDAAGFGTYILGRGKQPTRLEVSRDGLGQFIGQLGLEPVPDEEPVEPPAVEDQDEAESFEEEPASETPEVELEVRSGGLRVFISHGKNIEIVDQVKTMLDLADLDYEIAVEEESAAIPVPEKVFGAMRNCTAAVICVTADDEPKTEDGDYRLNDNVLIEIGAAFVLYEKKVVLVWDRRIPIPSNLQGLYRCEFEGDELSWSAGMKLMKAVNKFKKPE